MACNNHYLVRRVSTDFFGKKSFSQRNERLHYSKIFSKINFPIASKDIVISIKRMATKAGVKKSLRRCWWNWNSVHIPSRAKRTASIKTTTGFWSTQSRWCGEPTAVSFSEFSTAWAVPPRAAEAVWHVGQSIIGFFRAPSPPCPTQITELHVREIN